MYVVRCGAYYIDFLVGVKHFLQKILNFFISV